MRLLALVPLAAIVLLPAVALAAAPKNFAELANLIVSVLDGGVGMLITVALVLYLFGISRSIYKAGEEGKDALRTYFLWGIITIFLMVSIWGILQLLQNSLFGSAGGSGSQGTQSVGNSFQSPDFSSQ